MIPSIVLDEFKIPPGTSDIRALKVWENIRPVDANSFDKK
jgi:hypothetical protein